MASIVVIADVPMLSMEVRQARRRPDAVYGGKAGAGWLPVKMHSAGAALADAATKFGACHAKDIAQDPKQRNIAIDIHNPVFAIDFDLIGHGGAFN